VNMKRIPAITLAAAALALVTTILLVPQPLYSHWGVTTNLTYKKEIAQIFQRKCFQCHSDNNLSMSLTTSTDARPWARAIREEVIERRMPPWSAVMGFGHFANDVSLTAREMDMILRWADGGAPSGVLKVEEPIPPFFVPAEPEWAHGKPDLVLTPAKSEVIEAGARAKVVRSEIATGLSQARWVRAIGFRPGDRRVVRSVVFRDAVTKRWLGAWTPWQTAMSWPAGTAYQLPAKSRIALDILYSGTDEQVSERGEVGLYFSDRPSSTASTLVLAAAPVVVPAGTSSHRVRGSITLDADMKAFAIWPDVSAGAKSIEVMAVASDGMVTPLVWVKDYRAEWPSPYVLASPVSLAGGTKLVLTAYFENPEEKPRKASAQVTIARY
jgi:hypothetical protein